MAHHRTIDKARWLMSQKKRAEYWHGEEVLEKELDRIQRSYTPVFESCSAQLTPESRILDLGCGPVCAARFIEQGEKTYLDPMLDDFRRAYPGKLPKGRHLAIPAEAIPDPDKTYDLILCIDALDHMMNPELALHEMDRLLKPDGILVLGLLVFPSPIVRLRYILEHFVPFLRDEANPYSYTLFGLKNTLARHFEIINERYVPEARPADERMLAREYAFICRPKQHL